MIRNKLSTTLFRSLLRWNRRPEVVNSRFELNAHRLGVEKLLPSGAVIKNAEGVQATIYHCFRTLPATQENIELGLKVLRELNQTSAGLVELSKGREARESQEAQSRAIFRVGQVVQHIDVNVRGVVAGWLLDESKTVQIVEVLPDLVDTNEFTGFADLASIVSLNANQLKLVEDRELHRIINRNMPLFFEGYDETRGRYVPTEEVRFWYHHDMTVLEKEGSNSTGTGVVAAGRLRELNYSLRNVNSTIASLGQAMSGIVHKHAAALEVPDTTRHINSTLDGKTVAQQVLDEVGRCISACAAVSGGDAASSAHLSVIVPPAAPVVLSAPPVLHQPLRRGGALGRSSSDSHSLSTGGDRHNVEHGLYSGYGSKLIRMSAAEISKIFTAVGYLGNCYSAIDQLLQLRFQHKGLAFHDGLRVASSSMDTVSHDGAVPVGAPFSPRLVSAPEDETVAKWHSRTTEPAAVFKVGQVVRHKALGYRGVVAGFDMRPPLDLRKYDHIAGSALGQEQPLYKVIPDERELDNPHGSTSQGWHVSQEWLEPVTERADQIVQHRDLSVLFDGFDFATGMYKVPHKLRYAFPANSHSGRSASEEQAATAVYHAIDEVLVELFGFLRKSFSTSRVSDAARVQSLAAAKQLTGGEAQPELVASESTNLAGASAASSDIPVLNMQDLLMLLRYAPTHDRALYVESVLWLIWMSHPSPEVMKLTRLSMGQAKRGNYREAIEIISHASSLDPTFAEAYNKLASFHHCLQEYDECITYANKALEIVPEHVGSLSGLGLSYEHKGMEEEAVANVRRALRVHPYAAHLPTMLVSMLSHSRSAGRQRGGASRPPDGAIKET